MLAVRFLRRIRVPVAAACTSSPARLPRSGKNNNFRILMKLEGVKSQSLYNLTKFSYETFVFRNLCQHTKKLLHSRYKVTTGSMIMCAALGSMTLWPQIAFADGSHRLADHSQTFSSGSSSSEGSLSRIIHLIKKFVVPLFLFLNVCMKWGKVHPIFLAARVMLIFLITKPIPSSVHIFVDQLRDHIMSQQPLLYRFKPINVNTVEVEDYTFLCMAKVDINDDKFVIIGILGSWWILPLSSWKHKLSLKKHMSLVKSRFRLAADMSWY